MPPPSQLLTTLHTGLLGGLLCVCMGVRADGASLAHSATQPLAEVEVTDERRNALGSSDSASQGVIHAQQLQAGALLRPADVLEHLQADSPVVLPGDMDIIQTPMDFLGINYYCDGFVRSPRPEDKPAIEGGFMPFPQRVDTSAPAHLAKDLTALGWVVTPEGIGNLVKRVHRDWPQIPYLVITENGAGYDDVKLDGKVDDVKRTSYIVSHLQSLQKAIAEGVPVKGYFAWSLLDNFEWAEGYNMRFGLVYVDYPTQKRIPKQSAFWYRDLISEHKKKAAK